MTARRSPHVLALSALGAVVLVLASVDFESPLRPVLTLVLFAVGPGAAILPRMRVPADFVLEASLAVGISVAITMVVAQAMVWTGWFSPIAAVLVVLAMLITAPAHAHPSEEAIR